MHFISIEKYKDIDKFKKELQKLEEFVTDNEWLTMLKYDIALNPDLSDEISKIIDYIDVDTFTAEDYNDLILKLKDECIKLKNDADLCDDKIEKWYKYRHAYAYYGMIEVITEGSIITEKILDEFKRKYGDNYLDELKKIDNYKPSSLTNFNTQNENNIDLKDEIIKIYLLMKYYQDEEHVFHERDLIKDHRNARQSFEEIVRKNYPHLEKVSGKSLLMLVILDNVPLIDINILSRFILVNENKNLANIIGGKGLGLSILNTYGLNVPETYLISVTSLKEGLYKDEIEKLKNQNYAVRSSATVEDNENNSFAGLFISKLNVPKNEIYENVKCVRDSINNERVNSYVEHFNTDNPYMSVVVQKFKEPILSGVWIGNDINSGYLEWVNGNGEKLVSGHVKPTSEKWPNTNDNNLNVKGKNVGESCLELQQKLNSSADLEWCISDDKLVWLQYRPVTKKIEYKEENTTKNSFVGVAASRGTVIGKPIYLEEPDEVDTFEDGSILLTDYTDPDWVPIILRSSGIITAEGGFLSHTAIISRELGIPCVTGLGYDAIEKLKDEEQIEVNGNNGSVKIIGEKVMNNKMGEYTDLYDENKNLTGEKLFREKGTKLIVPKGRYSIVVLAFIENSKGEFLFQMTSKRKKNVWATTGGHVKSGQTSKEAIIEEIKEELGIDINEDEVILFKTYKYDDAFKDVFYIKKDIDINSLTYEKDEVEYVKYLTKDEILDLINNNGNIRKTNIDAFLDIIEEL